MEWEPRKSRWPPRGTSIPHRQLHVQLVVPHHFLVVVTNFSLLDHTMPCSRHQGPFLFPFMMGRLSLDSGYLIVKVGSIIGAQPRSYRVQLYRMALTLPSLPSPLM